MIEYDFFLHFVETAIMPVYPVETRSIGLIGSKESKYQPAIAMSMD